MAGESEDLERSSADLAAEARLRADWFIGLAQLLDGPRPAQAMQEMAAAVFVAMWTALLEFPLESEAPLKTAKQERAQFLEAFIRAAEVVRLRPGSARVAVLGLFYPIGHRLAGLEEAERRRARAVCTWALRSWNVHRDVEIFGWPRPQLLPRFPKWDSMRDIVAAIWGASPAAASLQKEGSIARPRRRRHRR